MKDNAVNILIGVMRKTITQINGINGKYVSFSNNRDIFPENFDLVILAEIVTDFYTCLETVFVRISKVFENNLEKTRWHTDLLDKMIIEIPGIRKALLSERTYGLLKEIMRFRHFKTYYFELEYDRDRIDFLEKKYNEALPLILKELELYIEFLEKLNKK